MRTADILNSGDLELIANLLCPETVREHFGEDSGEYETYRQYLRKEGYQQQENNHQQHDDNCQQQNNNCQQQNNNRQQLQDNYKRYKIPRRTESPAATAGMIRNWIREFHELNGMKLPKYFSRRTGRQLRGMFYGMCRTYRIDEEEIVSRKELELCR